MGAWRRTVAGIILCAALSLPSAVRAFDPMTMSSAAPQALELASLWSPHAINAMQSCGIGFVKVGESAVNIFRLPLGVLQATLGYPFGYGGQGLNNCMRGFAAPFELVYNVLMLPVRIFSLGTVR